LPIENNKKLDEERENLMRLEKGIYEMILIIQNYIAINDSKYNSLKNIYTLTKSMSTLSLNYDNDNIDNSNSRLLFNNLEILENLHDKYSIYCDTIKNSIYDQLKVIFLVNFRFIIPKFWA